MHDKGRALTPTHSSALPENVVGLEPSQNFVETPRNLAPLFDFRPFIFPDFVKQLGIEAVMMPSPNVQSNSFLVRAWRRGGGGGRAVLWAFTNLKIQTPLRCFQHLTMSVSYPRLFCLISAYDICDPKPDGGGTQLI
jgi:hypothetical protein